MQVFQNRINTPKQKSTLLKKIIKKMVVVWANQITPLLYVPQEMIIKCEGRYGK